MSDLHVTHHLAGAKLGPKLGPFPVAVWAVIIAGGLYVAHRRSQSLTAATTTTASTDTTATDTTGTSTDTTTSSDVPFGVSSSTPVQFDPAGAVGGGLTTSDSSSAAGAPVDNAGWSTVAVSALVKAGVTPIVANNAVDKFLSGDNLTTDEANAVNRAITLVGPPPEGAPPVHVGVLVTGVLTPGGAVTPPAASSTPPAPRPTTHRHHRPAPKPPATHKPPAPSKTAPRPSRHAPAKTKARTVTVHSGDTLAAIARAHHVGESALYSTNRAVIEAAAKHHGRKSSDNGHYIYAGTVLALP